MVEARLFQSEVGSTASRVIWLFLVIATCCVLSFWMVPQINTGGDALTKWDLVLDLVQGDFSAVRSYDPLLHHQMRWASILLPAFFVAVFSDSSIWYYVSSFIQGYLGLVLFSYLALRHIGLLAGIATLLVLGFDPGIYEMIFQLLPTGGTLLPLALLVLFFALYTQGAIGRTASLIGIFVATFLLYGVKETNLFFMPGLAIAILIVFGFRQLAIFTVCAAVLYIVEGVLLSWMAGHPLPLGRLYELTREGAPHLALMVQSEFVGAAGQEALWDGGIFSRWWFVALYHKPPLYLGLVLFSAYTIAAIRRKIPFSLPVFLSVLGLSFAFFTTFFVISLDPLVLGQPLRERYLFALLPLSYFVIFHSLRFYVLPYLLSRKLSKQIMSRLTVTRLAALCIGGVLLVAGSMGIVWNMPVPSNAGEPKSVGNMTMAKVNHYFDLYYATCSECNFWDRTAMYRQLADQAKDDRYCVGILTEKVRYYGLLAEFGDVDVSSWQSLRDDKKAMRSIFDRHFYSSDDPTTEEYVNALQQQGVTCSHLLVLDRDNYKQELLPVQPQP